MTDFYNRFILKQVPAVQLIKGSRPLRKAALSLCTMLLGFSQISLSEQIGVPEPDAIQKVVARNAAAKTEATTKESAKSPANNLPVVLPLDLTTFDDLYSDRFIDLTGPKNAIGIDNVNAINFRTPAGPTISFNGCAYDPETLVRDAANDVAGRFAFKSENIAVRWNSTSSQWEILSSDNTVLYSSTVATAQKPPALSVGNWTTDVTLGCPALEDFTGDGTDSSAPAASLTLPTPTVYFNTSGDLNNFFSTRGTTNDLKQSATGGIENSGQFDISGIQGMQLWTFKQPFSPTLAHWKASFFAYGTYMPALGVTNQLAPNHDEGLPANDSYTAYLPYFAYLAAVSENGEMGFYNMTEIYHGPGNMNLTNDWYYWDLDVTYKGSNIYELVGKVYKANQNGSVSSTPLFQYTKTVTNPGLAASSEAYIFLGFRSTDVTKIDNFYTSTYVPGAAPTASTTAVNTKTSTTATLPGTVTAGSAEATVTFEYSTSSTLAGATSIAATPNKVAANAGSINVSASITGLTAGTTYYYRAKAVSSAGTKEGEIKSFTTDAAVSSATEYFEDEEDNTMSFTNASKVFDIGGKFHITNYPGLGYGNSNYIIDNYRNCMPAAGVVGSIKPRASGYVKVQSLWLFGSEDCQVVSNNGSANIIGKKSGVVQYTITLSGSQINNVQANNNGFTFVDFSTFDGANNKEVDEIEFTVGGALRYLAIDNFSYNYIPVNEASSVVFANTGSNKTDISWTNGTGTSRAVFVKASSTGTAEPANNTSYTANTVFGSGSQIGNTGWYNVYNGTGSSVTVTGLTAGTTYRVMVVEYNGAVGSQRYNSSTGGSGNPANVSTISAPVTEPNVAPFAVATATPGASSSRKPSNLNDNVFTTDSWSWVPGGGESFIEYTWDSPFKLSGAKFYFYNANRVIASTKIQYWDGAAYVDILTYNTPGTISAMGEDATAFPEIITTTKLRFSNITERSGSTDPAFREIQVFGISANASLSALTLGSGVLSPAFSVSTTSYTATVANNVTSTTVTATKAHANASIQIRVNNGTYSDISSGSASSALDLNEGDNTIDIKVTAADGTTIKTYTIVVTREVPALASVSSIARTGSASSNASSVSYTATFSTAVTGLSSSSFSLTTTGLNGASIAGLTGSGATYTVNVNTGTGNGTLVLKLADATGISPEVSNVPFNGEEYTIDKLAPVISGVSDNGLYKENKTVTFDEGTAELNGLPYISGTEITAGNEYTLVVTDAAGNKTTVEFTIDKTTPAKPTELVATPKDAKVELSWKANADQDLAGYKVYIDGQEVESLPATATSFEHLNALNGTKYAYKIVAVDKAGNESAFSTEVTATPKASQSISFAALADKTYGDAAFDPGASASSKLDVSYESGNTAVAKVENGMIYIVGAGEAQITAKQEGSTKFLAAEDVKQTLKVSQKEISGSFTAENKVYDGTDIAAIKDRKVTPLTVDEGKLELSGGTASFGDKQVGTAKKVTATGMVLSGDAAKNYKLISVAESSANITALEITGSFIADNKEYDGTTEATIKERKVTPLAVDAGKLELTGGTASFENASAATGKKVTATGMVLSGDAASNYKLTSVDAASANITAKELTVSLKGTVSKIYDNTTTATLSAENYSLPGVLGSDVVSLNNPTSGTYDTKVAGTNKTVQASGLSISGADAGNYKLASATASGAIGEITPRSLTATLTGTVIKIYNGDETATLSAANYSLPGLLGNDVVNLNNPTAGTYDTKLAGTGKTVQVTGLAISGADAGNYTLSSTTASAAVGTISARPLTATLTGTVTKEYDGNTDAVLTTSNYSLPGVLGSDVVTLNNPTSGAYNTRLVGTGKTVQVSDLAISGADAANYNLTSTTASAAVGSITRRQLTVSLTGAVSKVYNGTTAATLSASNYSVAGILGNDVVNLNNPVSGVYNNRFVGTGKTIQVTGLAISGADANNYSLSSTFANAAIGEITKKDITLALLSSPVLTKVYDGTTAISLAEGNYSLSGVASSDLVTVAGTASFDNKDAGTAKVVTGTNFALAGTHKDNYTLTTVSAGTTGTITKKKLTITADDKEKYQGVDLPTFTASFDGFITGESRSVLLTHPSFSTTADRLSPASTYPIVVSGATALNYDIEHKNGVLTVKPGYPTSLSLAAATFYENQPAGVLVGTLSSTSDDPGTGFSYSLTPGAGDTDNGLFTVSGNEIRTNRALNYEDKALYHVRVRTTASNSLLSLDKEFSITLSNVNEQPTLAAIDDQTICYTPSQQTVALGGISAGEDAGQSTTVSVNSTNNALFKSLTVTQANNGNASLRYTAAAGANGTARVTVTVTDNGGTANGGLNSMSQTFDITVNALPVPAITSTKISISKGEELVLTASGGTRYEWLHASGIKAGQNTANLTIRPDASTTYRVIVYSENNCSETKDISIEVKEDFIMVDGTNLVTPNGDGVNDNFVIKNLDMYPNNEVKIFDRAGRLLYGKKNYNSEWNGTLNGAPLAEDTYYYVVDFGPGKPKLKGFITIVRD